MANILITDGEQRAALATVRSLARAGHSCLVCSASRRSLAGSSRYTDREFFVSDPALNPSEYAADITSLVRSQGVHVVLPMSEPSLLAVLASRNGIPARIPFPDLETFEAICDKKRVLAAAEAVGIRVPRQWVISAPDDQGAVKVSTPLVLKPARSVYTAADGTRGKVGVRWVSSASEMACALRSYPPAAYPILAQEAISGPGIGVFVLIRGGRCIARFSHVRIREKPPSGGVSVLRQSEPMDERLFERSLALLDKFDWSGVAMIEYKRDESNGEPVLMEINGRFWGSLQLAVDAGVDFPRLLVDTALEREISPVHAYRLTKSRWFWGDVDHLLARWRGGETTRRDRAAAALRLIRACGPGYREEVFRWRDPRPFLHETRVWLGDAWRVVARHS